MDDQDGGLMLNFAAGGTAPRAKQSRARGRATRGPQSTRPAPAASTREEPATKKPRLTPRNEEIITQTTRQNSRPTARSKPALPPGGIISSLFDARSAPAPAPSLPKVSHSPTNAPSTTSDFASLGLDPLLVAHLASKMGIGTRPTSIQKLALPPLLGGSGRDVFIQAQTGSGKTLTYLLPIVQSLLPLCEESFIDRRVGTLAIILAPTRELARQIYEVLEKLVSLALTLKEQAAGATQEEAEGEAVRRTRWLVPSLLCGGSTRNHEKQRLRKGCPVLVSTPGRLLDHLRNTESFDSGKCRWLVLDEADRLLEMGFEEQLSGIINALDGRRRIACGAAREAMPAYDPAVKEGDDDWIRDEDVMDSTGLSWWAHRRRVVLCSATLDENVQVLAGKTLQDPLVLRGGKDAPVPITAGEGTIEPEVSAEEEQRFSAPAQLEQNYLVTPPKLRLVTLLALLRTYLSRAKKALAQGDDKGTGRVIVFMSCTDSVDFHWKALGGASMSPPDDAAVAEDKETKEKDKAEPVSQTSVLLPSVPIFKLHGSMAQSARVASLRAFSRSQERGAVLLCTSVASRGLDLPQVSCVVQLDAPTEGGVEEYLHRVGRTARVGKKGESWLLVLPQEEGWVHSVLEHAAEGIRAESTEEVLMSGYGGSGIEYQSRATEVQLAFERWVLSSGADGEAAEAARKAYLSHVRAYATHPAEEKKWFNVRQLHLGHLAKAFALREAPKNLGKAKHAPTAVANKPRNKRQREDAPAPTADAGAERDEFELSPEEVRRLALSAGGGKHARSRDQLHNQKGDTDAEKRMYAKVRAMGKLSRRNGVLAAHGADDFQLA